MALVIIVVGASAGGVESLLQLVRDLPADLPAAVCVVLHFPSNATSRLPSILNRAGRLHAQHATHGQALEAGCLYIGPPDHHLLIAPGKLLLARGPQYNGLRPSIDHLFRTAARAYGERAIGVVLSGALDDGTAGLEAIKARGGLALVQDPADAPFDVMPRSALAQVAVDYVLPAAEMGPALGRLALEREALPAAESQAAGAENPDDRDEAAVVAEDKAALERGARTGEPSMLTCPDCGGVLWELRKGDLLRFRCHVGHSYTAEGLRSQQQVALERALWTAMRGLEESAALARRLANRAQGSNNLASAGRFEDRARLYKEQADIVRDLLEADGNTVDAVEGDE